MLTVALRHHFPGLDLDVAFTAPTGITAIFGQSGTGKTTIINAVAGLLHPDHARITLNETTLADTTRRIHLPPHRRRIGYVFQDARLFPHLTVQQNLTYGRWFAPRAQPGADPAQVIAMLDIEPLLPRRPATLSGGEKQRIALGRALLAKPRLLLMDEPLAALDDTRKSEILPYLERLRDHTALPILYISHSTSEVARLANHIVLIGNGRVQRAGPVEQVLADPEAVPELGLRDAGAVITAQLVTQHPDGLTELATSAGTIFLPQISAAIGNALRLRIPAQDVILSRNRPEGLSALNILPATVTKLHMGHGPGALVQLQSGSDLILARLTARSAQALELAPGTHCFAILKSVAIAQGDVGLA